MEKLSPSEAMRWLQEDPGSLFLDLDGVMFATSLTPRELLAELRSGRLQAVAEGSADTAQGLWKSARVSGLELTRWMEAQKD
jgi:hypothetical protein